MIGCRLSFSLTASHCGDKVEKIKVVSILGTRPELIRLSRIIGALDRSVDHKFIHTGQNSAPGLRDVFFDELGIRTPDHTLAVDSGSFGRMMSDLFAGVERVLLEERPAALLVLGDTNSALAAIVAKRMGIPIFHMEAGNRSFDAETPEETNRRVIDHVSDFNLVYTEAARRNLLREGLPAKRVYLTGSPLYEVFSHYRPKIEASPILDTLNIAPGRYLLASLHRQENVDDRDRFAQLLMALETLGGMHGVPVVVSTHPRTRQRLDTMAAMPREHLRFLPPFGYFDWCKLQRDALCVVSDSGTVSEEAALLAFPAVTPRRSMERPEAMEAGLVILSGTDPDDIVRCVALAIAHRGAVPAPPAEYTVPNVSERVVKLLVGTASLSRRWAQ